MKERDIQRLILDYLAAKRIWHIRLNTGAMSGSHKGKRWFVKFGKPGMSDILALRFIGPDRATNYDRGNTLPAEFHKHMVVWIEVKAPKGKLSEAQEQFRKEVTEQGMKYVVVRSLEDLQKELA